MAMVEVITREQYGKIVYLQSLQLICVFFTASWVPRSGIIEQSVDHFTQIYSNVIFLKVVADLRPDLVPHGVSRFPTFHFLHSVQKVAGFEGFNKRKLNDHLYQLSRDPFAPVVTVD